MQLSLTPNPYTVATPVKANHFAGDETPTPILSTTDAFIQPPTKNEFDKGIAVIGDDRSEENQPTPKAGKYQYTLFDRVLCYENSLTRGDAKLIAGYVGRLFTPGSIFANHPLGQFFQQVFSRTVPAGLDIETVLTATRPVAIELDDYAKEEIRLIAAQSKRNEEGEHFKAQSNILRLLVLWSGLTEQG